MALPGLHSSGPAGQIRQGGRSQAIGRGEIFLFNGLAQVRSGARPGSYSKVAVTGHRTLSGLRRLVRVRISTMCIG